MARHIKWFDLARFGAALRVVPVSPLRGVAVTCLEIRDCDLYQRMYGWSTDRKVTKEERRELYASFKQALQDLGFEIEGFEYKLQDLGFGELPKPVIVGSHKKNDTEQHLRFFSTKTEYSLSELRRLFPGLGAKDMRDMPVDEIRLVAEPEAGVDGKWADFADSVLAVENRGVWTPVTNPFDKPYAESGAILEADQKLSRHQHTLLGNNTTVSRYFRMQARLHQAIYRQNALVPFYADLESALTDGWKREDLQQVDLPYAAPLWVTQAGKIIALKDIRYAPEIMDVGPEHYYSVGPGGLIVSAIREAKGVAPTISKAVESWREMGTSPEKLETPDLLWASINEVVSTAEELRRRYPFLPPDVKALTDENEAERGGTVRAIPLTDITVIHVQLLTLIASRYLQLSDPERHELTELLWAAVKRGHELMADHEKELAKQNLREHAESVQADAGDGKVNKATELWCKAIAADPFFGKVAELVSSLSKIDGEVALATIHRHTAELYGENIRRKTNMALRLQERIGAIMRNEDGTRLVPQRIVVSDEKAAVQLIEAAIRHLNKPVPHWQLLTLPVLYPFKFDDEMRHYVTMSPRLEMRIEHDDPHFIWKGETKVHLYTGCNEEGARELYECEDDGYDEEPVA